MALIPREFMNDDGFFGFGGQPMMPFHPMFGAPAMHPWLTHRGMGNMMMQPSALMDEKPMAVVNDDEKFAVKLDVHHFKPEELKVKLEEDMLCIEGDHEEKTDEHGIVSRRFVRKYKVPRECDLEQMSSIMSNTGMLCIQAPKKGTTARTIPITMGGEKMMVKDSADRKKCDAKK